MQLLEQLQIGSTISPVQGEHLPQSLSPFMAAQMPPAQAVCLWQRSDPQASIMSAPGYAPWQYNAVAHGPIQQQLRAQSWEGLALADPSPPSQGFSARPGQQGM